MIDSFRSLVVLHVFQTLTNLSSIQHKWLFFFFFFFNSIFFSRSADLSVFCLLSATPISEILISITRYFNWHHRSDSNHQSKLKQMIENWISDFSWFIFKSLWEICIKQNRSNSNTKQNRALNHIESTKKSISKIWNSIYFLTSVIKTKHKKKKYEQEHGSNSGVGVPKFCA